MGLSPSELRIRSRSMEADARELEDTTEALEYLRKSGGAVPSVDIEFQGAQVTAACASAAKLLEDWIVKEWDLRREELLAHLEKREKDLKEKWT